jgi:hypothetical protein
MTPGLTTSGLLTPEFMTPRRNPGLMTPRRHPGLVITVS